MDNKDLKQKTIKNVGIVGLAQIVSYGIQVVSGIFLARLLAPSDFGLVAISSMVISMLAMIKDAGFESALIQKKDSIEKTIYTAFTTRLIISIILYIAAFAVSPLWAKLFAQSTESISVIEKIVKVLSLSIIFETFAFVLFVLSLLLLLF